jgi:AraC-like DNA-binding protein
MNIDGFYLLLLCFVSGFTQCALIGCAVFLLKHHRTYLFQKLFALTLVLHSFGFFNNFVVAACQNLPFSEFLNTLLIFYDYIIVGAYMMFAVSLVYPTKFHLGQLLLMELPFACAMLLFAITRNALIYPAIQIFTLVASLVLMICLLFSIRRHTAMLRDNVGNLEYFDLRWSAYLCILLFVIQVIWAFESVSNQAWFSASEAKSNLLFDSLYCIVIMVFAAFVSRKIVQQKVYSIAKEEMLATERSGDSPRSPYHEILIDKDIESTIRENRYYLDNSLTLQKLATLLGTNRQYLSTYINQEKQKTFYDYINDFRLEEAKALMDGMNSDRPYSLDEVAGMSGFNSYSTFLRSFAKKYGLTPSKYMREKGGGEQVSA